MDNETFKKAADRQKLLRLKKLIDEGEKSGPAMALGVEAFLKHVKRMRNQLR